MTLNQFIGNITLLILVMILVAILIKVLKTHKRSIETLTDGAALIGISGWIIQILSYQVYCASLPALIFLIVILIQILRCHGNITKLYEKEHDIQIKPKKLRKTKHGSS